MPVPHSTRSKKAKNRNAGRKPLKVDKSAILDRFLDEINDAQSWKYVAELLCRIFDLPNLNSRGGLKKIHANFPAIQENLDATYEQYADNEKVLGGIVGIWAAMASDSILRAKLVDAGVIEKILPALDMRSTRYVALEALSTITHHGGGEIRVRVASHTRRLLRLMEEFPDNAAVNELAITILAHAVTAALDGDTVDKATLRDLELSTLFRLTLAGMRDPAAKPHTLTHGISLFAGCALHGSREMRAIPAIANMFVAGLRSQNLTTRCQSLVSLWNLMELEADKSGPTHDPLQFLNILRRGVPSDLSDILMKFGPERSDIFVTLKCQTEYTKAMMGCVQDHDLLSLGRTQAHVIVSTEYSVGQGAFQIEDPRTGKLEMEDPGIGFVKWIDALPICAKVLRATGDAKDRDMADILDLKFLIYHQLSEQVVELANRAIGRNPQVAYFYYALGLGYTDSVAGLRACKKGLMCKETTPFVRTYLLWCAVDHAARLGLNALFGPACTAQNKFTESVAFIMSALDDAQTFMTEAAPDSKHMITMIHWYILLSIAFRGPELGLDLKPLDAALQKLDITKRFLKFLQRRHPDNHLELVAELVLGRFKTASSDWGTLIARLDAIEPSEHAAQLRSESKAEDTLAAWMADLHVEGEDEHKCFDAHPTSSSKFRDNSHLYRCTYCGNPSAVLRKCSGCGTARYCDASCQRAHWKVHKVLCKETPA